MTQLEAFLQKIPKCELHVHFGGTVARKTLEEVADKHNLDEKENINIAYDRSVFNNVFVALKSVCRILKEPEDLRRAAYEMQRDAANNGVRYREVFWNPTDHLDLAGIAYADAQDGLIQGFIDAEKEFGIIGRLVPGVDRSIEPERAVEMVSEVIAHPSEYTLGIGIDYPEATGLPETYWKAYHLAHRSGLRCTAHAGEDGSHPRNIETCLDLLNCTRIDHGYTVLENESLTQRCLNEGIVFTVIPSNSYYHRELKGQDWRKVHPIRKMMERGLKMSIASDDPTLHETDPGRCYVEMVERFGATLDDVRRFIVDGIDGSWAPDELKENWRIEWLKEFDKLRAALPSDVSQVNV